MSPPRDDDPPSTDDGSDGDETGPDGDETGPDASDVPGDASDAGRRDSAPQDRPPGSESDGSGGHRDPGRHEENERSGRPAQSRPGPDRDAEPRPGQERGPDTPGGTADRGVGGTTTGGRGPGTRRPASERQSEPVGQQSGRPGRRTDGPGRGAEHADAPPAHRARDEEEREHWLVTFLVDVASSAVAVLLVGFFLFTVSGVWPPMVAVESPSMTPHMKTGDLVFVMEEHRFAGEGAHADTGVVTARVGEDVGYYKFSEPGDVVVYEPDGNGEATPIIHRAMFWVEKDERWYERADKGAVGNADSCRELANCPAPHAGFITKGDANPTYDQVGANPHSGPVKPAWIVGTAEERIPGIGCIRLRSKSCGFGLHTSPLASGLVNASG